MTFQFYILCINFLLCKTRTQFLHHPLCMHNLSSTQSPRALPLVRPMETVSTSDTDNGTDLMTDGTGTAVYSASLAHCAVESLNDTNSFGSLQPTQLFKDRLLSLLSANQLPPNVKCSRVLFFLLFIVSCKSQYCLCSLTVV